MKSVTVRTNANISLIKYWGKRDEKLFLPTKSSLIITLDALATTTTLEYSSQPHDAITLNWQPHSQSSVQKIIDFIHLFRTTYSISDHFVIKTHNNFPTGAGLASSSSGFAALAIGLATLCRLNLSQRELSILARQGSGSASRSITGGIVIWHKGELPDGTDSYAEQLFDEHHWPELRILVVVINDATKKISSRDGMRITTTTSPSYGQWLKTSEKRMVEIIPALAAKDFLHVGHIAEQDWSGMHTSMLDASPCLDYWTTTSYIVMDTIRALRTKGTPVFFTTEAGPNVKVLCFHNNASLIKQTLASIPGVISIIESTVAGKPSITVT